MKKLLLFLVALITMGVAKAEKQYLTFETGVFCAAKWNAETNTFTWGSGGWNPEFTFMTAKDVNGDLSSWTKLHLNVSDFTNSKEEKLHIVFKTNDGGYPPNGPRYEVDVTPDVSGNIDIDLSSVVWGSCDITNIGDLTIYGCERTDNTVDASVKVTEAYLYRPDVISAAKPGELSLKNLPWNKKDGSGTETPVWNMNVSTDTYYGNYSGDPTHYVDLTSYDELRIYRDNNDGFRAFFINAAGTGTNTINNVNEASTWNAEGKYWSVDLGKIEKWDSKIALKSIKSASSGTNNIVKNIVVYDASATNDAQYVFVGEGILSPAAQAALEDATVTIIDATGVTGTGVTLTPANPNTIFKANAGVLANTKNVMVGTTIANLELTDGYPFAVPSGATATAATYTRSMSNKYGTVCLPYAVASTDAVKYYTIESLAANELTLKAEATLSAGTPAIVEMVSGSSITATGSGALAEAGAPTDNLKLIGTYEAKTILASDYAGKGIYAISNNQFVQATNSINLPAFRAFFTAAPAESNIRLVFDDDATAIDALSGEGDVTIEGIYSLDGAEKPSLQKGINVVKFSNGEVKKVIVK